MKVAIVYNRDSKSVINLFGQPNREKIGLKTIRRLSDALKQGGHQVTALEADKDLVDRLEEFMPRVVHGERPGMVFNVSYGLQGQARYTHVPSILEMVGVPYVASGPLAHSLALDKVVTKMILRQHGLPTPDFAVLDSVEGELPDLPYPLIVKPKNEAVSFGLKVVHDDDELRAAADVILQEFHQPVLVERYIEGREINVGILGNNPPEAFPPVELLFGDSGPAIYTEDDKKGKSGRTIGHQCPADVGERLSQRAQEVARRAFQVLGCADCARVDLRLDPEGNLYILEVNSLPSLGEHGSYLVGAAAVGLDFSAFVNRLVEVAAARYFGTPSPPQLDGGSADPAHQVFGYVTQRRDDLERRLKEWTNLSSHTDDPVGLQEAVRRAGKVFSDLGMTLAEDLTDERSAWTWQTRQGLDGGLLFLAHLDVPKDAEVAHQQFRREPEWLYGEGVGSSRAALAMLEFALRAVRRVRRLRHLPMGVSCYTDEGRDARYSGAHIRQAAERAGRVIVLRPGNPGNTVIHKRRGQRMYRFRVAGEPSRPGRSKKPDLLRWTWNRLEEFSELSSQKQRVSVNALDVRTDKLPLLLPHQITATVLMTYPDVATADALEQELRSRLGRRPRAELELLSDRPPLLERKSSQGLLRDLAAVAGAWDIPWKTESSVWPSVAGLVPASVPCVCGMGPVAQNLGTSQEAVQRISLVQRTLLLAEYLLTEAEKARGKTG